MSKRLEVLYEKRPCYDIVIERDFDSLGREMARFAPENRRLCIVTDSQVEALYGERIRESLSPVAKEVLLFSFPAGEASKTLDTVRELYCYLIEHRMERKDMLIALGGGVVGDLTGFAAATYL